MKKNYVLDTSVLMSSPYALFAFEDNNIYLVDISLEELDNNKVKLGEAGANARKAIRMLEELRLKGNLYEGVSINDNAQFKILVSQDTSAHIPDAWDPKKADNKILAACKTLSARKEGQRTVLVSNDIALRVKANLIGIQAEEYQTDQAERLQLQYKGRTELYTDTASFDKLYSEGMISANCAYRLDEDLDSGDPVMFDETLIENEYVLLKKDANPQNTALTIHKNGTLHLINTKNQYAFGIKPRNIGQRFAMHALMESADKLPLVILKGPAGTGKTIMALACGLEKCLNAGEVRKILITRANIKFDEDFGYLPGDEQEKEEPLLRCFSDNLEQLLMHGSDKVLTKEELYENGTVSMEAMAYMRGRSITDTWVIIDETQNLTPLQILGIITRAGQGTKFILCGDPDQIDNPSVDSRTNGLSFASERMKGSPLCAQVSFEENECVRSALATEAISRLALKGSHLA